MFFLNNTNRVDIAVKNSADIGKKLMSQILPKEYSM
jgi:hypothetical protein